MDKITAAASERETLRRRVTNVFVKKRIILIRCVVILFRVTYCSYVFSLTCENDRRKTMKNWHSREHLVCLYSDLLGRHGKKIIIIIIFKTFLCININIVAI